MLPADRRARHPRRRRHRPGSRPAHGRRPHRRRLPGRRLLVLVNHKQLLPGTARLGELRDPCPWLTVPATSRTRLRLRHELDALRRIVADCSDEEIGDRLLDSRRTASRHVSNALAEPELPARTASATHATRHGLRVEPP